MLLTLLTAEHSPFFQHFTVMDLGPFGQAEAVALLGQHSPPEFPIGRNLAEHAVAVLGGHPFYLQLLGETLTTRGRAPDLEDLKAALQELLFSGTGRLALYFENEYNRLVGRATSLAAVLDALAPGPLRTVWSRMEAEAARHGWQWVLAAVGRDGRVLILDPSHAVIATAARLGQDAIVDNLLLWLDRPKVRT